VAAEKSGARNRPAAARPHAQGAEPGAQRRAVIRDLRDRFAADAEALVDELIERGSNTLRGLASLPVTVTAS
jgi:hypothetical protein